MILTLLLALILAGLVVNARKTGRWCWAPKVRVRSKLSQVCHQDYEEEKTGRIVADSKSEDVNAKADDDMQALGDLEMEKPLQVEETLSSM